MARLKKGSAAAKAWGRRMRAARGRGRKKRATKKKVARKRTVRRPKVTVGGIAYEPVAARKARGKKKVTKKRRRRAAQLPYGYSY